ncbi:MULTISPECIES: ROK family transcriptional regulator [unclassified Devosia]|uniref:ROK family transcriptional regulator n=1 Tax=unclassified Devosia TaxID=196773 RepID=UPI0025C31A4B|nr:MULTISPECIES: ROK family transcriptional regulator [unclassified Devosia]
MSTNAVEARSGVVVTGPTSRQAGSSAGRKAGAASRGTNQTGVRLYNERLVLSLIRRHGELPKADIARMTGLSPQTISIITNALEADGLLLRGKPLRGKVGQPLVPYSLNPEGALSFGLKIGRRSVDLYLINFTGQILKLLHKTYPYPTPDGIREFARSGIDELLAGLPAPLAARIAGLGIAAPYEMWTWHEEIGAPKPEIDAWRQVDVRAMMAEICPWPVYFANDITAACAAELMFGIGADHIDYLYVFIGSFIGGGLVLNGHLFPGRTQNAGALGSMPAPDPGHVVPAGRTPQLMNVASIYVLERELLAIGRNPEILWQSPDDWGDDLGQALDRWIDEVAESLAYSIVAAIAVIDVETVLIDGAFPTHVRSRIIERTGAAVGRINRQGLSPFRLLPGSIGNAARAMGGASLPLLANFTQDREVLFKDNA